MLCNPLPVKPPPVYGSVCSGIESATAAWHPLGWKAAFYSEIDPFPRAVLAHRYPATPCHGDFTSIGKDSYDSIQLLVGGTPCQSFSVAGLRKGLADERGNLTLEFVRLAQRLRPRWLVWENVPGVLSQDAGRAFGSFLGALAECGYGFAYRVLDAQYFGVPQRRKRVFVVGHLGDWRPAAAVLFERESLRGDITPSREARQAVAALTANGVGTCGADDNQAQAGHLVASALTSRYAKGPDSDCTETLVTHTLRGEGFDASEDGTGRGTPLVAVSYGIRAANTSSNGWGISEETSHTLDQAGPQFVSTASVVRRLTPTECERLQGFPDGYTAVPFRGKLAADGPRYKAIGNSMAVPVMRWLGERILLVDGLLAA